MDWQISISVLVSLGTLVASIASAAAVVKTKLANVEKELGEERAKSDTLKEELNNYKSAAAVKVAILESNQENHARELADIKADIRQIMSDVQDVKELVIKFKKGEA